MNEFDRFDLDPLASAEEITERFRELVEDSPEAQRQTLRDAWEALTLHPRSRVAEALATFVDVDPAPLVGGTTAGSVAGPARAASPPEPLDKALLVPLSDVLASLVRNRLPLREPSGYLPLASDPLLEEPHS